MSDTIQAESAWNAPLRAHGHLFVRPSSGRGPRVCQHCAEDQQTAQARPCVGVRS